MTSYKCKNIIVEASCKEDAINMFTILSSEPSLVDKLLNLRKEIRKYFNIGSGSLDSILQIKCNSEEGCTQLKILIEEQGITKKIERDLEVKPKFTQEGSLLLFKCIPESALVKSDAISLSLSEFLYISRNKAALEHFVSKYKLDDKVVTIGSNSVNGILQLSSFLQRYKNRLCVDYKKI